MILRFKRVNNEIVIASERVCKSEWDRVNLVDLVILNNIVDWLKDNQKDTHLNKIWLKKMFSDIELNCFSKRQKYNKKILLQQEI